MNWISTQLAIMRRTVERAWRDRVIDVASSIAFYTVFGIFPLLLLVVAASTYFMGSEQVPSQLYRLFDQWFPASGDLVRDNVRAVTRARGGMGVAGMVGLVGAASAGFGAVTRAINHVMGTTAPRYSFVEGKLRYLVTALAAKVRNVLMAIAVSMLLVVSVMLATVVELLVTTDPPWFSLPGLGNGAVVWALGWATSFLIVFFMFALIYKEAPYVPLRWREVLPGALLAAVITEIGKVGFLTYLERVANLQAVFGSLTSIMVLLMWLFLAAVAVILGVEYNTVRAEGKATQPIVEQRPNGAVSSV